MSAQPQHRLTPDEYLALDRAAEFKSEYYDGVMYAMSGGSAAHALIAANLIREFGNALKGRPCRVYTADLRVRLSARRNYTYPDVEVVCGEPKFADDQKDSLINPTVLVEVLSPSTEAKDRGFKFDQYKTVESLEEYVLISQTRPHVEIFRRQPEAKWLYLESSGMDTSCRFESIDCHIAMSEIYYQVNFEE